MRRGTRGALTAQHVRRLSRIEQGEVKFLDRRRTGARRVRECGRARSALIHVAERGGPATRRALTRERARGDARHRLSRVRRPRTRRRIFRRVVRVMCLYSVGVRAARVRHVVPRLVALRLVILLLSVLRLRRIVRAAMRVGLLRLLRLLGLLLRHDRASLDLDLTSPVRARAFGVRRPARAAGHRAEAGRRDAFQGDGPREERERERRRRDDSRDALRARTPCMCARLHREYLPGARALKSSSHPRRSFASDVIATAASRRGNSRP